MSIDQAWAEAEAALPREALIRIGRSGMSATGWATVYLHGEHIGTQFSKDGPAAALRLLTDRLRSGTCGCTIHDDRGERCRNMGPICGECMIVCWGADYTTRGLSHFESLRQTAGKSA